MAAAKGNHAAVGKTGAAVLAALAASAPAAHAAIAPPTATSSYRILANPTGGDDFLFRNAIQANAQDMTTRLFNALVSVLGGSAPTLNFILPTSAHMYATNGANQINIDPLAVEALTNPNSSIHSPGVLDIDHEMAHLRQTPAVLANVVQREGGAQAFADDVTPVAAQRAAIPYTPGNYDANYADYVNQVRQQLGNNFIMGGQFGHPPVQFP